MDPADSTFWILSDAEGRTAGGPDGWYRWGRGVTHRGEDHGLIAGYHCRGPHLPFLLDPAYECRGPGARLWSAAVPDSQVDTACRVLAAEWTTLAERSAPGWVGGPRDVRVRLTFAILAATAAHPDATACRMLRELPLDDLVAAGFRAARLCGEAGHCGLLPHELWLAAKAVSAAACEVLGQPSVAGGLLPCRPYAWYSATAACCAAGVDLEAVADEAVAAATTARSRRRHTVAH